MQTYKRLPVEFVRGRGRDALRRATGEAYLDFLAGISVLQRRPLPPARRRGDARAGRPPGARLQPLLHRARRAARRARSRRASSPARACSCATRARRPTRPRSSLPASAGAAARSSCSRAPSTAARWARCRRRPSATSRSRSRRSCRASWSCRATTPSALAAAVGERDRGGDDRADPGRVRRLADLRARCCSRRARPATAPARC